MLRCDPYDALTENCQLFWKRLLASGCAAGRNFRRVNEPGGRTVKLVEVVVPK